MSDPQQQGVPAVGFLVMAFTDEKAADQMLDAMKQAKAKRRSRPTKRPPK